MSAEGKKLKESYIVQATEQWGKRKIIDDFVEMEIHLFFSDKRKRDIDNYNKLAIDALSGVVLTDDSQIYKLTIYKAVDTKRPRVEININVIKQK